MRKLIWLFLLFSLTATLTAQTRRRVVRDASLRVENTTVLYRGDAARTGQTALAGPRFLETERWTRPLQGPVIGLVFDRGVVYAGGLGALTAVNAATGADNWVYAQAGAQFSPVAIVQDTVYVSGGSVFYALDRATGAQLWSVNVGADIGNSAPLLVDGVAYVGSASGTVHAISLSTRAQLWSRSVGSPVRGEIASAKNVLVVRTEAALLGLKIHDGDLRWSQAGAWSNPTVDDKNVYAGVPGAFHALDLSTGTIEWTFDTPFSTIPLTEWGGAAVTKGIVLVGNANHRFYFLNANDGTWRVGEAFEISMLNTPPILGTNDLFYFGAGTDPAAPFAPNFLAYSADLLLGSEQSIRLAYGHVTGGVAIGDGAMYVHDSSGTLSAFVD